MKKLLSLVLAGLLCVATVKAQTEQIFQQNTNQLDQLVAEYVEENSPAASYFEAFKDASFPTEMSSEEFISQLSSSPKKEAAGILNILLGDFGVGHFYTGQTLRGVLDILFCWTGIPAIIGLVEGIIWLCDSDEEWEERVAKWNR